MKMWVAREPYNKDIECFDDKPTWDEVSCMWVGVYIGSMWLDSFPEVTFENSPMEVELKLVNDGTS